MKHTKINVEEMLKKHEEKLNNHDERIRDLENAVLEMAQEIDALNGKKPVKTGKKAVKNSKKLAVYTIADGIGKGEGKQFVQISFDEKPTKTVINNLKNNGFRWFGIGGYWSALCNDTTIGFAETIANKK